MKTESQKNRKYWNKVIKEDRWWDFSYFLKIIEHKLNHMILNWDKSIYVDARKDKEKMKEVRDAIRTFRDDNFLYKYTVEIDKKYGKIEIKFEDIPNSDNCTMKTFRNGKPESKEAQDMFHEAVKKAEENKKICKAFIFDTIRDEIENWWD